MAFGLSAIKKKELVNILINQGIKNKDVLQAIYNVNREKFVNEEFKRYAYDNNALPIDANQTISQPYTVAFMTELLEIEKGDKILEVGTGSGYQAAVLSELGANVYSIERIKELYDKSKKTLSNLGIDVKLKLGDGTIGWKEFAPFNGIIVTAGSPKLPENLMHQLAINGRLVIPVGDKSIQQVWKVKKILTENKTEDYLIEKHSGFRFVPLLGAGGW